MLPAARNRSRRRRFRAGPGRRAGSVYNRGVRPSACGKTRAPGGTDVRRALVAAVAGAALWLSAVPGAAQATAAAGQDDEPFHLQAARALAHGRDAEAEELAGARDPGDPEASAILARLLIARGRYEEAEARLAPAAAEAPGSAAALELGLLRTDLGRRADGRPHLNAVVALAQRSRRAIDLYRGGVAARALGEFRLANSLLRAAAAGAPSHPGIQTTWGSLFLEKYNQTDALRSFSDALSIDAEWVPALLGRARALASDNPPGARQAVARALTIDADNAEAHLVVAGLELGARNRGAAREAIGRALATNPRSLEARALLAAIAFLEDRTEDFEAEVERALAINPAYGDVYRIAAVHTAGAYRFPEAVGLARRAVELEPGNTRAHAELGLYLLRTGDEPAARVSLERSFADDPFDVMTFNLLAMMDTLAEFETFERGDVILRLHPDEAPVLGEYALALAQEALDVLSARYDMTVEGPVLIEIFPRHDDFAVRTLGLPGMIGALGACFGRVVTMDSPRARPPGDFNWQSTLWHEIAHVITLQMSRQRLPRWLSEGISTYEEKRADPAWARDQALEFADALNRGQVLPLRELNSGFRRPDLISLSYFHASVLVEHFIDRHGEPALQALIRAYGDGLETEAALARIGLDFDTLQASFDEAVAAEFGPLQRALTAPEWPEELPPAGADRIAALRERAAAAPDSFRAQLALGRALFAAREWEGSRTALERAAELVPLATGFDSPHGLLARIAQEQGDRESAKEHLERLLAHDETSLEAVRLLAALAEETSDEARLRGAYERLLEIDPFDPVPHQALGRLAMAGGRHDVAVREFDVALALGPVDRVVAHSDYAESLLAAGDADGARRQALAALEIAPTYERAQDLLLEALERGP